MKEKSLSNKKLMEFYKDRTEITVEDFYKLLKKIGFDKRLGENYEKVKYLKKNFTIK